MNSVQISLMHLLNENFLTLQLSNIKLHESI